MLMATLQRRPVQAWCSFTVRPHSPAPAGYTWLRCTAGACWSATATVKRFISLSKLYSFQALPACDELSVILSFRIFIKLHKLSVSFIGLYFMVVVSGEIW